MKLPLSRCAPSPSLTLRVGGGRSQRGGAALARLPSLGARQFLASRAQGDQVKN